MPKSFEMLKKLVFEDGVRYAQPFHAKETNNRSPNEIE
jgi:hypothetical protein